jgi:molecular chaperone GrpE
MTHHDAVAGTPGGGAESAESATEAPLQEALSRAEALAQENWDKYLRAVAELDNVRKRAARDVEQARKVGIERLVADLLPAVDSLEMGLSAGKDGSAEALLEGQQATLRLLKAALERAGVTELSPAGERFDPQLHEALSIQRASSAEPGSVVHVIQKGYQVHGRLLRAARVVVAESAGEPRQAAGDAGPGDDG